MAEQILSFIVMLKKQNVANRKQLNVCKYNLIGRSGSRKRLTVVGSKFEPYYKENGIALRAQEFIYGILVKTYWSGNFLAKPKKVSKQNDFNALLCTNSSARRGQLPQVDVSKHVFRSLSLLTEKSCFGLRPLRLESNSRHCSGVGIGVPAKKI